MKFTISMKHADAIVYGINDAVDRELPGGSALEVGRLRQKLHEFVSRWVEWGDYLHVEFDTEAETARVIPNDEEY